MLLKAFAGKKLVEKDDIAIWQKPANHLQCKKLKKLPNNPSFCPAQEDTDKAWYTKIETCLIPLPDVSDDQFAFIKFQKIFSTCWFFQLYILQCLCRDGLLT